MPIGASTHSLVARSRPGACPSTDEACPEFIEGGRESEVRMSKDPMAAETNAGPSPMVRAVLFDLDDTLIDSFEARRQALDSVFRAAEIESPSAEQFLRGLTGRQLFGTLETLAPGRQIEEMSLSEAYRDIYWSKQPGRIGLYPGISSLLKDLRSRGVKLGVVTQKGREFEFSGRLVGATHELGELGVADLFSVVVGFEDVSHHKPDPEGVKLALDRLGVLSEDALLVGDSAADIEAAKAAGCASCHATWGLPGNGSPVSALADYVASSPAELHSLLL